ncbi:MAG: MBL fold metallo-hydrolase [Planctomycetota bacterium]
MSRVRRSTAVLVYRGREPDLEVLLVERNPELRFLGGYWALPGGVVGRDADGDPDEAHRACALRELFEECGILAVPEAVAPAERRPLREALLAAEAAGRRGLREGPELDAGQAARRRLAGLRAPFDDLCELTTPPMIPVPYQTRFLALGLPPGEACEIWPGELVGGGFWRPDAALHAWRRGDMRIAPPVLMILALLAEHGRDGLGAVLPGEVAALDAGRLHPVRFVPGIFVAPLRTPTLPPATTTNTILVGEERVWIVDPATPDRAEQARLFDELDRRVAGGSRLEGVLLTHHHQDHVQAAVPVARRYDLPVLGHPLTLERVPLGDLPLRPLHDGDVLPLGRSPDGRDGWRLECLHTPGHDRGHLVFQEDRYHALVAGDLVSTVSTIVIDPPEGHLATYLRSLERVLDRPSGTIHPAHGPAHPDSHALLRWYLEHRAERERKLLSARARGLDSVDDLLPLVYDDVDPDLYPLAARSLAAGIEKLVEEGRW